FYGNAPKGTTVTILSVERRDGAPDNCGDPAGQPLPAPYPTAPTLELEPQLQPQPQATPISAGAPAPAPAPRPRLALAPNLAPQPEPKPALDLLPDVSPEPEPAPTIDPVTGEPKAVPLPILSLAELPQFQSLPQVQTQTQTQVEAQPQTQTEPKLLLPFPTVPVLELEDPTTPGSFTQPEESGPPRTPSPSSNTCECELPIRRLGNDLRDRLEDLIKDDCCDQILEKLQLLEQLLTPSIAGSVDLSDCDAQVETAQSYMGEGLQGLSNQVDALITLAAKQWEVVKCGLHVAIPEHWEVKTPQFRPQLVVQTRTTDSKSSSRWSFSIPHYRYSPNIKPSIQYTRGNWMCVLDLSDNSHIFLNCSTQGEGKRVLTEIKSLINPEFTETTREKFTLIERGIKVQNVTACYASFYGNGDKREAPDWSIKL
ncbi:MAG: hypothetical protein F6K19_42270, partial [Cyanothece sp. SIO1E1]|nr:hypothetical protein [Cyanothece sp. SIO1E1]